MARTNDSKNFWGPHYWFVLHSAAASYDSKQPGSKQAFKDLLKSYKKIMPCDECKKHLQTNLEKLPPDLYFNSADNLFLWTYNLHDIVNRQLKKTSVEYPIAKRYYFENLGLKCAGCEI